ncbi:MAG: alpha/beta hydrolase [Muribaculaceae bacterium]|nr:alpha/beta hydrolase [Muribaculaceae bacterium]
MKRIFAFLCVAVCLIAGQVRGEIYGVWKGMLLGQLPLVIHVVNDSTATLSSPAQGASEIPCDFARVNGDTLNISLKKLGASFRGVYRPGADKMRGLFVQGIPMQIEMARGVEADMYPDRPQTPVGPFEYREEEVSFRNGDVELSGTLTIPSEPPTRPGGYTAVVLASGSGVQNRDEELFGHKPFAVIADKLTRSGIAVLRFDDRGAGKSSPRKGNETSADNAADVMVAVDFLRGREEINSSKVGILGHSEGGTLAFINAAEWPDKVGFVVSLAGMAVKGEDLIVKQNTEVTALRGEPLGEEAVGTLRKAFRAIAEGEDSLSIAKDLRPLMKELHPNFSDAELDAGIAAMTSPWYIAFVKLDPGEYLAKVKCPVLALNGTWDVQVDSEMNLRAIAGVLPGAKTVAPEGLNHMFQRSPTRAGSMNYGGISQTISPEVLELIASWISER